MMDHALRRAKDAVYRPVAFQVGQYLSPLSITLLAGIIGLLCVVACSRDLLILAAMLWWLNRILDGLDGAVARATNQQSDLGGYLDTLIDFTLYALIPFALVLRDPSPDLFIALAFLLSTFYINAGAFLYLSSILERRNMGAKQRGELTTVHMPRGLIEGAEAIVFYSAFILFPQIFGPLMIVLSLLVIATTLQHVIWASRNLRS